MSTVSTERRRGVIGSKAIKVPCVVATTANITLSGEQTIDGVACVTDDRVLVKDQTTASENGIYVVDTSTWERSLDFDGTDDITDGTLVFCYSGTTNKGWWYVDTANVITIGTTSIVFTKQVGIISAFIQTLFDDANAAAALTTLGVSAFMQTVLDDANAATAQTTLGISAFAQTLLDDANAAAGRVTLTAQRQPCVTMIRAANSTNDTVTSAAWVVYDETGAAISTAGTTTDGLQEAITYAARYGYDLKVYGGGIKAAYYGQAYGGALGADPFATTSGSKTVVVTHTSHGRVTGDKLTFNGLSATVNSIPAAEFAAELSITVINANSYSVTVATTNATATSSAGGATCRWQDSGQDVAIINCTTGVVVPPIQGVKWDVHATINFSGATSTIGVFFDSIMASEIRFVDQIVCGSNYDIGVDFAPAAELPQDPNGPVITSSRIYLPSVIMTKTGSECIRLNTTSGDIADNVFDVVEPNGGGYGIYAVFSASHGIRGNQIRVNGAHSQTISMISIGGSATGASNSHSNHWDIQGHPGTGAVGVDIWSVNDYIKASITSTEGTPTVGIKLESSASGCIVVTPRTEGTTTIQDSSTDKSNLILGPRVAASVHRNASNQTAIATATWTKVAFTTEVYDAGAKFDSATNYRWTPGRPGLALITANSAWTTAVDATLQGIAIYKDGSAHKEEYSYASGTGGSQGPNISAQVLVDTTTTYFEIWVRQDSGGNADLSGAAADTFAMFSMIG